MDKRLRACGLTFSLGSRTLINDVSLSLSPGELVALIGPNGAGKSTLLRLLTGYLTPQEGERWLDGHPLEAWSSLALSRKRAVMRQQTQPGFDWPVESLIRMGRAPWSHKPERDVIDEVMTATGCQALAGRHYGALSGGEQQRVQLARALAQLWTKGAPQGWLFLDEPTSALDLYHQQHLLRLMKRLTQQGQLHVCVVLHDLNLAALWADRIVLLHQGRIVAQGAAWDVLQAPTLSRWYGAQVHVGSHPCSPAPQVFLEP